MIIANSAPNAVEISKLAPTVAVVLGLVTAIFRVIPAVLRELRGWHVDVIKARAQSAKVTAKDRTHQISSSQLTADPQSPSVCSSRWANSPWFRLLWLLLNSGAIVLGLVVLYGYLGDAASPSTADVSVITIAGCLFITGALNTGRL